MKTLKELKTSLNSSSVMSDVDKNFIMGGVGPGRFNTISGECNGTGRSCRTAGGIHNQLALWRSEMPSWGMRKLQPDESDNFDGLTQNLICDSFSLEANALLKTT